MPERISSLPGSASPATKPWTTSVDAGSSSKPQAVRALDLDDGHATFHHPTGRRARPSAVTAMPAVASAVATTDHLEHCQPE